MAFEDRRLRCAACGSEFVWTAGEQRFFAERQLAHEPRRCRSCQAARRRRPRPPATGAIEVAAVCTACGRSTTVPFRPAEGRPVFCRRCLVERRAAVHRR
jgi:CxxC-x17-CxxC domain-containing protein